MQINISTRDSVIGHITNKEKTLLYLQSNAFSAFSLQSIDTRTFLIFVFVSEEQFYNIYRVD